MLALARQSVELVHLLQLQSYFPQASLATIIRGGDASAADLLGADAGGPPVMCDAGTETPVHFIERHVDPRCVMRGEVGRGAAWNWCDDEGGESVLSEFGYCMPAPHRYHWNEWDMRRRALKNANLKNARTVSVQSNASFFRRDNETQVYPPKDTSNQTGVSRGTNPPRVVRYIEGTVLCMVTG